MTARSGRIERVLDEIGVQLTKRSTFEFWSQRQLAETKMVIEIVSDGRQPLFTVDDCKDAASLLSEVHGRHRHVQQKRLDELALLLTIPAASALVPGAQIERPGRSKRGDIEKCHIAGLDNEVITTKRTCLRLVP